jgi:hypothetical protein
MVDEGRHLWIIPQHKTLHTQKEPAPRVIAVLAVVEGLVKRLLARKGGQGRVFRNTRGRPWTGQAVVRTMERARERADLGPDARRGTGPVQQPPHPPHRDRPPRGDRPPAAALGRLDAAAGLVLAAAEGAVPARRRAEAAVGPRRFGGQLEPGGTDLAAPVPLPLSQRQREP